MTSPNITCPRCKMTSYNPNDVREGYCGNCHDWTRERSLMTGDYTYPWENTVDDGKFRCWVTQDADYHGTLRVQVVGTDDVILEEEVGIAYGAMFGPDVDDVAVWQDKSLKAIDAWIDSHG